MKIRYSTSHGFGYMLLIFLLFHCNCLRFLELQKVLSFNVHINFYSLYCNGFKKDCIYSLICNCLNVLEKIEKTDFIFAICMQSR